MIEDFKKIYDNRHTLMQEWKEKNPDWKVMGYMCSYMPEEILYAANVLPVASAPGSCSTSSNASAAAVGGRTISRRWSGSAGISS